MDATKGELAAIRSLRRLEQKWPDTIWLYCTGNGMHVFRCGENGVHVMDEFGVPDMEFELDYITGISHDGGDF
jgi:hypothetical protein